MGFNLKSISSHIVRASINRKVCNIPAVSEQILTKRNSFWFNVPGFKPSRMEDCRIEFPSKTMEQAEISGWFTIRESLGPHPSFYLLGLECTSPSEF